MRPKITLDWLNKDVGPIGLHYFQNDVFKHLYGTYPKPNDIEFGMAPSLVARSECELFGVSAPRFAVRARLKDGSFANLRRLGFLQTVLRGWAAVNLQGEQDGIKPDVEVIKKKLSPADLLIAEERIIADSFFVPSESRRAKFHIICTTISTAYGECLDGSDPEGVPFVQHMRLGGGLCAQAVCLAAGILMHKYASEVVGVSEITARATANQISNSCWLRIGGLNAPNIAVYLKQVDLGGAIQKLPNCYETQPSVAEEVIQLALRAYVLSNCPVIALTDTRFMEAPYSRLGIIAPSDKRRRGHCVLIVGCARSDPSAFLMNDPAQLPFMEISCQEIISARPEKRREGREVKQLGSKQDAFTCIPVTPGIVRVPLLDATLPKPGFGLYTVDYRLRTEKELRAGLPAQIDEMYAQSLSEKTRFLLLPPHGDDWSHLAEHLPDSEQVIEKIRQAREAGEIKSWVWLQIREDRIVVWNATNGPCRSMFHALRLILGVLYRNDNAQWGFESNADPVEKDLQDEPSVDRLCVKPPSDSGLLALTIPRTKLMPSIISSIQCVPLSTSLREARLCWPPDVPRHCDAYLLMQTEKYLTGTTAASFMAANVSNQSCIQAVANHIASECKQTGFTLCAFASFIPTLTFSPNTIAAREARDALCFMYRVAMSVQNVDCGRVHAIEVVCGSRVNGLFPAIDMRNEAQHPYISKRIRAAALESDAVASSNIVHNLEIVAKSLRHELDLEYGPVFALELEPGPLFAIRDWDTLQSIAANLPEERLFGFNLDIAHWALAKIDAKKVETEEKVFNRIVHAHLSGWYHDGAHFGDLPPLLLNEPHSFFPWLDLLYRRLNSNKLPRFSGHIALELEACRSEDWTQRGILDMIKLLDLYSQLA